MKNKFDQHQDQDLAKKADERSPTKLPQVCYYTPENGLLEASLQTIRSLIERGNENSLNWAHSQANRLINSINNSSSKSSQAKN